MSNVPANLRYTKEHEWCRVDGGVVVIGITDHAQSSLGDVVFVELPEVGKKLTAGKAFGVVESVKAVSDLYAPIDGEVSEVNSALVAAPNAINKDAYASWMIKLKPAKASDVDTLLDAKAYEALVASIAK